MMSAEIFQLTPPSLPVLLQRQTQIGKATTAGALCKAIAALRGQAPDADLALAAWRQAVMFSPAEQVRVIEFIESEFESV